MDLKEVIGKSVMLTLLISGLFAILRYYGLGFLPQFNAATLAITFIFSFITVAMLTKIKED